MRLKKTVKCNGLRPECLLAMMICQSLFSGLNISFIITSITDSKHGRASLHYVGQAFDIRTRHMTKERAAIMFAQIKNALTAEFDVVNESDHIHVEYQPK